LRCECRKTEFWCEDGVFDRGMETGLQRYWLCSSKQGGIGCRSVLGLTEINLLLYLDLSSWPPSSPAGCPSPPVPLRVIPTLSTLDMKTAGENQIRGQHGFRGDSYFETLQEIGLKIRCLVGNLAVLHFCSLQNSWLFSQFILSFPPWKASVLTQGSTVCVILLISLLYFAFNG